MSNVIQFPTSDAAVAYIAPDARKAADRPDYGQYVVEQENVGVRAESPFSFRAYDLTFEQAARLLGFYNELAAS